ncbi:ABC transporter substrate-binding protein [Trueperella pyogenes]|uniref:heme/hemin ABC transporter substrate-binding protein n=1 Tax=Trueperella pyogenes TaxID=1661 RepID=UPI00043AB9D0|nr:ABC transporter substrate-binding protein [Trueperella pyogenes]AHU88880.1 ABC transporter substrate-binding protein [Trueperella pyogenes]OQD39440.1 ABC transporter substrate-binding protein [Trueperella pyogenes]
MKSKKFVLMLALAIGLAGCSVPQHPQDTTLGQTQPTATESTPTATVALPNPHELTGLSVVPDIADPEPLKEKFSQNLPATVTDFEGNNVTVTDTSRILAMDLEGTLSRTVIALGYGSNIVGRTVSSTEKQLADVPVVTQNGHSLNVEAILGLKPSVIIMDRSIGPVEAVDQLKAAGIPVVFVDPSRGIDKNTALITSVAQALGTAEAGQALAQRTERETQEVLEKIKTWIPKDPIEGAFLYVRGTGGVFFILGQKEGATALIRAVGAKDLATEKGINGVTPANAEALAKLNPEVIFTMSGGLESTEGLQGLLARPGVAQTRAGQKQRVIAIPDGLSLSFGPQTAQTLLAVARALYGVPE